MIKEKLMEALNKAASYYNGGESASSSVAKAAIESDFNEKQAERLAEMFNTAATLNKEKDSADPTGACELASKDEVSKLLLDGCKCEKRASWDIDSNPFKYDFYNTTPSKTNSTIEATRSGFQRMAKSASSEPSEPSELNVSDKCLCKMLINKIDLVKRASEYAGEAARVIQLEVDGNIDKIAEAIDSHPDGDVAADMFKVACGSPDVLREVSLQCEKVAKSSGGSIAKVAVYDTSPIDDILKAAEATQEMMSYVKKCEKLRDFYAEKAAEANEGMLDAAFGKKVEKTASVADFFTEGSVARRTEEKFGDGSGRDADGVVKIARMIHDSGVNPDLFAEITGCFEKSAAPSLFLTPPSIPEMHDALVAKDGIPEEQDIILNARRSVILADLITNDPIIRDADPNVVAEAYKTMVMSSPRVSLDKSQVRAFLRSAVNSVAISPNDAKVITDVDKGVALANVDRLTMRDSSIKDSNKI